MLHSRFDRLPALIVLTALIVFAPTERLTAQARPGPGSDKPQLVVLIVIDGLSEAQTIRYANQMKGGLATLLHKGSWFTNAEYAHATTLTAVGHATISTGAHPYVTGIVGNDWKNRETGERVYSVEDDRYAPLEGSPKPHEGTSPRLLQVSTIGDQLRLMTDLRSRVVGISGKDRGAILLAGHLGTAYFYNAKTGHFSSTTYYMHEFPEWWTTYYADSPQDKWKGQTWTLLLPPRAYGAIESGTDAYHGDIKGIGPTFPHRLDTNLAKYHSQLLYTPFADEYTLDFARAAVLGENLGKNPAGVPDLLTISLSTHDYMNHEFGTLSREAHDQLLRLDRSLGTFFEFLDEQVGLDKTLIALTADHGFGYTPEYRVKLGLEGGRIDSNDMVARLTDFLVGRFGQGEFVRGFTNPTLYLNLEAIEKTGSEPAEVEAAAAEFLRSYPGIADVFTRTQLLGGGLPDTPLARLALLSWNPSRSGELFVIQKSGWFLLSGSHLTATHGSPWNYDRNVPLLLMGRGVRPGRDASPIHIVDLAASLACLLDLPLPSGCAGKVLPTVNVREPAGPSSPDAN
jgi:hypothetical protein